MADYCHCLFGTDAFPFVIGSSPEGRDDAISWIKLGGFYFQPSELLKIGFIITFSVHLDNVKSEINKLKNVIYSESMQ